MSRRQVFLTASVALGLVFSVYAVAGVRLGFVARDLRNQTNELSALLGAEKSDGERLKSVLGDISLTVDKAVSGISQPLWKPIIWVSGQSDRFKDIQSKIKDVTPLLSIAPGALGIDRPRKYLLVFQNSAEARGTGGIIGGYASVKVANGKIEVLRVGSNSDLQSMERLPIQISKEFLDLYRNDPAIWQNSNMSPHFPYGARIYLALWQAQFKEKLDGVLTIDPIALSSILKVIGPVKMSDGREINSANVVEETLSKIYQRFETENEERKLYLAKLAQIVLQKISQGSYSKTDMVRQMVAPIWERRILFYSTNPIEQKSVEKSIIGGALDNQPNNEYRVVVENTSGNKMDYYLDRKVKITAEECGRNPITAISITFTNTVEPFAKLPSYVKGRLDLHKPQGFKNKHGIMALVYGPTDSALLSRNSALGDQSIFTLKSERHRPVLMVQLDLAPGKPQTVNAKFQGGIGPLTFLDQPLVRPANSQILDKCNS
jgi:hypothetical protein